MVIKNKNGTDYKVKQPNPIMKEQEVWSDFTLHNMEFDKDLISNDQNSSKIPKQKIKLGVEKTVKKEKEIPLPTPEVQVVEDDGFVIPDFNKDENTPDPTPTPKDDVLRPAKINQKLLQYKKDVMHCMLAETKENFDPLYAEKTVKINYVRTFTFENIILEQNDIQLIFWSHLDFLTKNSIVYPRDENHRWWKINSIRNAPDGRFFVCVPTAIQPSFKR